MHVSDVRCRGSSVRHFAAALVDDRSGSVHSIKARFYEAHANRPRLEKRMERRVTRGRKCARGISRQDRLNEKTSYELLASVNSARRGCAEYTRPAGYTRGAYASAYEPPG